MRGQMTGRKPKTMTNRDWEREFRNLADAYYHVTGELWPAPERRPMVTLRDDTVAELYREGLTIVDLTVVLKCSKGTVCNILDRAGQVRSCARYEKTEAQMAACYAMIERNRGRTCAPETKAKISEALRGRGKDAAEYGGHKSQRRDGYVYVYMPEHPRAAADGCVPEHTLVLEWELGRYLADNEVAHHINRVRNDNRPENLALMDKREHLRMHMLQNWDSGKFNNRRQSDD